MKILLDNRETFMDSVKLPHGQSIYDLYWKLLHKGYVGSLSWRDVSSDFELYNGRIIFRFT